MVRITFMSLGDDNCPTVHIPKKLSEKDVLGKTRIKCNDWKSLRDGIRKYVEKQNRKWNLGKDEGVGFILRGRKGYNTDGYTLKTVVFYRFKDSLE